MWGFLANSYCCAINHSEPRPGLKPLLLGVVSNVGLDDTLRSVRLGLQCVKLEIKASLVGESRNPARVLMLAIWANVKTE